MPAVVDLQKVMTRLGYYSGPIRRGLRPCDDCCRGGDAEGSGRQPRTAVYGPATDAALKGKGTDTVVPIQTELAKYGYYTGPIDGNYSEETKAAVQQSSRRISVSPRTASSGRKRSPRSTRQSPTERSPRRARRRPRQPRRRPRLRQRRPRRRPPPPSSRALSRHSRRRLRVAHGVSPPVLNVPTNRALRHWLRATATLPAFGSTSDGGAGIRTQGALARPTVFKTAPFDRSGTPPFGERSAPARSRTLACVFARMHTLGTTPDGHDRGLELLDEILPWLRDSTGYRGHGATLHARPVEDRRDHALGRRGRDARVGRGGTRPG